MTRPIRPEPTRGTRRWFLGTAAALSLSACASLPRGAPLQNEVLRGQTNAGVDFVVYPVTKSGLDTYAGWPATGAVRSHDWPHRNGTMPVGRLIAPGDRVAVTVWDASENSLLTAPQQKLVTIEGATVSPGGTIFVPYIDRVQVAGRTPEAARSLIQRRMVEEIVPSAQVQLAVVPGRNNSADLVGGVRAPGRYPLESLDTTILNLISLGGGPVESLVNPSVKLVRGARVYRTSLADIYDDPKHDTVLRGGDKIILENDDRTFVALGATGREELITFPKDQVTALEAVSLAGGITDSRADPQGILILRDYPQSAVRPAGDPAGPEQARTIFTLDITSADGLFSANRFTVNPGDVVVATESPVTNTQTVLGLLGRLVGTATVVNNL